MIQEPTKNIANHFEYAANLSELSQIKNDETNIAIYSRDFNQNIATYLATLSAKGFNALNVRLNINEFESVFDNHFKDLKAEEKEEYEFLKKDIKSLLVQFSAICSSSDLKIFFGAVGTDMCRRFHIDMYELRMLCTYSGQGTMWLTEDNTNFEALNSFKENEDIVRRTEDIQQVNSADVAIIKGGLYPNSKVGGIVHRSPNIEHLNQKRIVLRVDSNSLLDNI